jgi:hypothetical protein
MPARDARLVATPAVPIQMPGLARLPPLFGLARRPLSEEDEERLIQEAIERDPGRPLYLVNVANSSSGR